MAYRPHMDEARLRAVIDRMIPADAEPGALVLGADRYVLAQLRTEAVELAEDVWVGVDALESAAGQQFGGAFAELTAAEQDALMAQFELQPWFINLAELTAEGFYADPANGGNLDARSWQMIGYEHRLPDGPSGPATAAGLTSAHLRRP
jgi:hypothetical protein